MQPNIARLTFGAEFEVVLPRGHNHASAAVELSRLSGLPVTTGLRTARTSRTAPEWRVVNDGSVGGNGIGAEFVSPVLKGQDGLEQVAKIARALVSIGATVNHTCGFHVHVGGFRREISFFQSLVKLYSRYELAIDAIMPASRRGNASTYCRSIARVSASQVDRCSNIDQIITAATGLGSRDYARRFYKLTLAAFEKHSTVEFRQHAGTVDAVKATNWIKTCLRIVAAAEAGKTGIASVAPLSFANLPEKARKVAEMVTRPAGATREEIITGTDWAALSVNRQARLAGLTLEVRRERGRDRFFASVAATGQDAPADLPGLFNLIEAPAEETEFFQRRAQELRAA